MSAPIDLVRKLRPTARPDTFSAETTSRLLSEETRRIQWVVDAVRRGDFGFHGSLLLAGFYPNLAELRLLFEELSRIGERGPKSLTYVLC